MQTNTDLEAVVTADDAHEHQRRGTRQLLLARGVFFVSAYAVSAILTRKLGPANYGVYGVIISQLIWLEMIVQAGIPAATAKLIADEHHDPAEVERSARALLLSVAGVLLVVLWVFAPALARLMQIPDGGTLFRIAGLDLPFAAIYASFEGVFYGRRSFKILANVLIAYALIRVAAVSAFALAGLSVERAILGILLSSVLICAFIAVRYPPRVWPVSRATIRELARLAASLALCLISGQVLLNLDLWSLKGLWTGEGSVIGEYVASLNLARTLGVIPTVQAGVLFSSVAWASAAGDNARAVRHIREAMRFAIVLAAAPCIILSLNGSEVLRTLFSGAYASGEQFLPIQLIGFGVFAVLDVFTTALMAIGRSRLVAALLTAEVPIVFLSNYLLIPILGPVGAAWSLLIGVLLGTSVAGALTFVRFGALIPIRTVIRVFAAVILVSLASAAVSVRGPWILVKLACLSGLYLLALYWMKEITPQDFGWRRSHNGADATA